MLTSDSPRLMPLRLGLLIALLASLLVSAAPVPTVRAATPVPTSVTIAGSLQSELGCAGDWDPGCAAAHLTYDAADDVWQGSWAVPDGSYEYKAALNNDWVENYGAHAVPGGDNIPLALGADTQVKFYYDHKSHWVTDNVNSVIAVAPGSYQSQIGCPGDWDPSCLRSWLQDPDGDGIYTFETTALLAGSYEGKVALNESWDVNYGQGGVQRSGPITIRLQLVPVELAVSVDIPLRLHIRYVLQRIPAPGTAQPTTTSNGMGCATTRATCSIARPAAQSPRARR